eukprot:937191-Prymnesium_polylepis.1
MRDARDRRHWHRQSSPRPPGPTASPEAPPYTSSETPSHNHLPLPFRSARQCLRCKVLELVRGVAQPHHVRVGHEHVPPRAQHLGDGHRLEEAHSVEEEGRAAKVVVGQRARQVVRGDAQRPQR